MRLCYAKIVRDKTEKYEELHLFRIKENIKHQVVVGDCLVVDTRHGKRNAVSVTNEFVTDNRGIELMLKREGDDKVRDVIGTFVYEETIWE